MGSNRTTAEGSPRQASPLQGAMKRAQPVLGQESNPDTPRAPPQPPLVARVMGMQPESESDSDSPPRPPLVARVMGMRSESGSDLDSPPRPPLVARVMGMQPESESDSDSPPRPPLVARVMGTQSESGADSDSPPRPPLVARVMGMQSESESDSETRQELHSDNSPRVEDGTELPTSTRDDADGSQVHSGTVATPPQILFVFADSAKPKPHPWISLWTSCGVVRQT